MRECAVALAGALPSRPQPQGAACWLAVVLVSACLGAVQLGRGPRAPMGRGAAENLSAPAQGASSPARGSTHAAGP